MCTGSRAFCPSRPCPSLRPFQRPRCSTQRSGTERVDLSLTHLRRTARSSAHARGSDECRGRLARRRNKPWEQGLDYDWVALVLEQDGRRVTFTQDQVSASYDGGHRGERRANRSFLGRPPSPHETKPNGMRVDLTRFDDFERALGSAISEGFRLSLAAAR